MSKFRERGYWMFPLGLFHWAHISGVLILVFLGAVLVFRHKLGLGSVEAELGLKRLHTYVGFFVIATLFWRLVLGLTFPARKKSKGLRKSFLRYIVHLLHPSKHKKLGLPQLRAASKLVNNVMFLLLIVLATTGVLRAGTDLYMPPFGPFIANWLAEEPHLGQYLGPTTQHLANNVRLEQISKLKEPLSWIHTISAGLFVALMILHIRIVYDLGRLSSKSGYAPTEKSVEITKADVDDYSSADSIAQFSTRQSVHTQSALDVEV